MAQPRIGQKVVVDVPASLSEEQEEAIRNLAEVLSVGVQEKGFWKGLFEKLTS